MRNPDRLPGTCSVHDIARPVADVVAKATEGCQLADCSAKATTAYFVQLALVCHLDDMQVSLDLKQALGLLLSSDALVAVCLCGFAG